jgi:hypothetical protein
MSSRESLTVRVSGAYLPAKHKRGNYFEALGDQPRIEALA